MKHIYKCPQCSFYTMKDKCSKCGVVTVIAKPLKFSPDDKLASYRRTYKEERLKEKGLR